MLNLITPEIEDSSLLESSYNAFKDKDTIGIVLNSLEKEKIFRQTIDNLKIPLNANFSFQNLFKLTAAKGCFYVAQCFVDFGYPVESKGSQSYIHKYEYQVIGIANLQVDLGVTHLRPENKVDRFMSFFFDTDIDFENADIFNERYYLYSDRKSHIQKYFDKPFITKIAKYKDVILISNGTQMFISFDDSMNANQTRILQDIFSSFKWLACL